MQNFQSFLNQIEKDGANKRHGRFQFNATNNNSSSGSNAIAAINSNHNTNNNNNSISSNNINNNGNNKKKIEIIEIQVIFHCK